jgi:PAS domain S-box-containing protein
MVRLHRMNPVNPTKGHIVLIEDISERERLEKKFHEQESTLKLSAIRFQESAETMQAALIKTDLDGEISLFNEIAQQVFGYAPEEILGKNIVGTIVSPGSRYAREMITLLNDVASMAGGNVLQAFENTKKNGEKFWMAWNTLPLRDAEGRITQVLLVGQDITGHDAEGKQAIRSSPWRYRALEGTDVSEEVFDKVFHICIEISREGRESKKIGTSFVMGDTDRVMHHSRQCAINAFGGVPENQRMVQQKENKENIKNFAQLDGAFVIRGDGVIVASSRHFIVDAGEIDLPMGYGTRHAAVAGITKKTKSVGIVVSESGGTITVFRRGAIVKQVIA